MRTSSVHQSPCATTSIADGNKLSDKFCRQWHGLPVQVHVVIINVRTGVVIRPAFSTFVGLRRLHPVTARAGVDGAAGEAAPPAAARH